MRKLLAIFFLTIFSFQVLPLRVIGKLISSNQNMEEVHNDASGKVVKFVDDDLLVHHHYFDFGNKFAFDHKVSVYIHIAEALPVTDPAEIPTPPPNC